MTTYLRSIGFIVGKDHVRTLLRAMGLMVIYPKRNLSRPHQTHPVYPYLLRDVAIISPNQVWSADITYIRLKEGFAYLVAILDWFSRYVLAWRLSNSLAVDFCIEALKEAFALYGKSEIFNSDQGAQFTDGDFTDELIRNQIAISMDGRGRCHDNIFVERLWRSVKYENVYLFEYQTIPQARAGLLKYFQFYNKERFHQSLNNKTPWQVYTQN
jgi:putative transposase